MTTNITENRDVPSATLLLNIFRDRMVQELTDVALAAIKPKIVEAAEAAVRSVDPKVMLHFDRYTDQHIIDFALRVNGKDVK